jgi:cytochrome c553
LPSLKNLSALEIETAMEAFRTGAREATLMNRIAKGFTADETRALAQWLATQGRSK